MRFLVTMPRALPSTITTSMSSQRVCIVTVVSIILGGVDPPLRRDGVRPSGSVMVREAVHVVSLLPERGGGRRTREARAHHDDLVLAPVRGVHQLHLEPALVPLVLDRTGRSPRVQLVRLHQLTHPVITATGTEMNPRNTTTATTREKSLSADAFRTVLNPSVCSRLQIPWLRWRHSAAIATM